MITLKQLMVVSITACVTAVVVALLLHAFGVSDRAVFAGVVGGVTAGVSSVVAVSAGRADEPAGQAEG